MANLRLAGWARRAWREATVQAGYWVSALSLRQEPADTGDLTGIGALFDATPVVFCMNQSR